MKLYHRTRWPRAKNILINGFLPTDGRKTRVESGFGVYCVCSLEDANRPYNKKHYGNAIVEITIPDNLSWEESTKVDFMHKTKVGDNKKNRMYDNYGTNGRVAVLWNTDAIQQLRISKDNGKTWYFVDNNGEVALTENKSSYIDRIIEESIKKVNKSRNTRLESIINECVDRCLRKYLNENLKTHDDEFNIYEKLEELDISYDTINDWENILEIETPDKSTKIKVRQLLNYYGWKEIKDNGWSICAERIYGDVWNDFYDNEAEKDNDYPYGVGIYYHITPSYKVPKILKQGLTVREGNKLGYTRGERTYLISYPAKDFAYDLFRDRKEKLEITILLVDIRNYLGKQINNFASDDGAVYTYDYIPPQCIKVYDTFEI